MSTLTMVENKDYELIPAPNDSTLWHIRILTGDFTETIFQLGSVAFNEIKDHFSFNFTLVESPDPHLTENDRTLHGVIARILEDIIERGEKEGWVKLNERKEINEFTDRADNTSKIIN